MPITIVRMIPPGSRPGVIILATAPTIGPSTIQPKMPIGPTAKLNFPGADLCPRWIPTPAWDRHPSGRNPPLPTRFHSSVPDDKTRQHTVTTRAGGPFGWLLFASRHLVVPLGLLDHQGV